MRRTLLIGELFRLSFKKIENLGKAYPGEKAFVKNIYVGQTDSKEPDIVIWHKDELIDDHFTGAFIAMSPETALKLAQWIIKTVKENEAD